MSAVYDAALEPERWSDVLGRLAPLFHSVFADKFARTHDRASFCGIVHGLDPADYHEQLLGVWSSRNVWTARRPVKLAGEILTTREILPREELIRSDMYADYLDRRGLHEGMRLAIWSGAEGIEDISLLRPWSIGPYTNAERDLAKFLMPHLRRSAEISRRLIRAELQSLTSEASLDRMGQPVLLLDVAGRIVHANPAALTQLRTGELKVTPSGLAASTASADRALQSAIQMAAGVHRSARSATVRLSRPTLPELTLTMIPVDHPWLWIAPERPRVLVFCHDPVMEVGRARAALQATFKLTPAEAALADNLLAGEDLAGIANRTGRSVNTLRTHLARLMAKTGTTRQSELVRRLLMIPSSRPV